MRKPELSKLIAKLGRLTPLQRRQVAIDLNAGESKATAVALIEKGVVDDPQCPHCDSKTVVRNGTAGRLQRFKCRDCVKTFNAIIGTPLARLRMKDKWGCATRPCGAHAPLRDSNIARLNLRSLAVDRGGAQGEKRKSRYS